MDQHTSQNPGAEFSPDQLRRLIQDIIASRPSLPVAEEDSQVIVGKLEMRFVSGNDNRPLLFATMFLPAD